MRFFLRSVFSLVILPASSGLCAQHTDSIPATGHVAHDSFYIIRENVPENPFWGNSWYIAPAYQRNRSNEFDLSIGRTNGAVFCSGGGCLIRTRSWGVGYGLANRRGHTSHLLKAFGEYTFFYFPPISWGLRGEYLYDLTDRSHYLRPSAGFSLVFFDVLYSYSCKLHGPENRFGHGITVRFKFFPGSKNWQRSRPSRC